MINFANLLRQKTALRHPFGKTDLFEEDSRKDAKAQSIEILGIHSLCDFASLRETSVKSTQLAESPENYSPPAAAAG